MPKALRHTLVSVKDLWVAAGPLVLLVLILLVAAYWVLDPTPPKRVVLATGIDDGAYAEFGKRYAQLLKVHGITVELRPTKGAAENLRLLRDPKSGVDIAFVQGGSGDLREEVASDTDKPDQDELVALGSLFYEPVWLFYREDSAARLLAAQKKPPRGTVPQPQSLTSLAQLTGWKINIGERGSGVPNLMRRLFEANHIDQSTLTLLRQPQTPAVVDFLDGKIDAVVFASAPESLMVQMLLQTPGIRLFDFAQADAYSRRFGFLTPVTLPRGVVDLASDRPPEDVHLVAPTASLVARRDTHPALMQLFLQAATPIHGDAGWFRHKGDFPSPKGVEWPLSAEAERYYKTGEPFLQRFMPFWLANLIERMWVVLVSIIAIVIPLTRIVPPVYEFRIRSRVFRWYGQLRVVEDGLGKRPTAELLRKLDEVEQSVEHVTVPLSYADELYSLRSHINMVRAKVAGHADDGSG
jgi:TRAP-type uncharacterized transport system substrate-binding protein